MNGGRCQRLAALDAQEALLDFAAFAHRDALACGLWIVEQVQARGLKPLRIRLALDGDVVWQYLMDGKTGAAWLDRKQATVERFGHSSLRTFESVCDDEAALAALRRDPALAICGGGVPIRIGGKIRGCLCISGLEHHQDHALAVQALRHLQTQKDAAPAGR